MSVILYSLMVGIFIEPALGNCPDGIAVLGHDVICPGEVGVFQCTTLNSRTIGWSIDGSLPVIFNSDESPGDAIPTIFNSEIYLVRSVVDGNDNGNRTSILHYIPDLTNATNVSIACSVGSTNCSATQVLVYGQKNIDVPAGVTNTVDGGVITYQWDHPTRNLVRHYIFTVDAPGLEGQLIQMNGTQFRIPHVPSTSHTYSATVRAVGLCGDKSDPSTFTGSAATTLSTMKPPVNSCVGFIGGIVALIILLLICIGVIIVLGIVLLNKSDSSKIELPTNKVVNTSEKTQ